MLDTHSWNSIWFHIVRLVIAVNSWIMGSKWQTTDKETIKLVKTWLRENEATTNINGLAVILGCSESRIYRMFNYQSTPLSLGEFCKVCKIFNKDPKQEFDRIMMLSNQRVSKIPPKDLLIRRIEEAMSDYHRLSK